MANTSFSDKVLAWHDQNGRKNLPWQKKLSDKKSAPYRVWVSEIMLQQTQVSTVIPYYEAFMLQFPTVESLAAATQDEVLHYWSGLGFYARGRNLHTTAKAIVEKHKGKFPDEVTELARLPGIGPSTAGAIISIALKKHAVILDGNVKRVLARHFAIEGIPTGKTEKPFWAIAKKNTPHIRVNDYTQAIMDLGATVCTPTKQNCPECPLKRTCQAYKQDRVAELPHRPTRKTIPVKETQMLLVLNPKGEVFLEQRPPQGIWGGLWSLPEVASDVDALQWCEQRFGIKIKQHSKLPEVLHTFSHFHLRIQPIQITLAKNPAAKIQKPNNALWYQLGDSKSIGSKRGLAAPVSKLLKSLTPPKQRRTQTHA